LQRFEQLLFFFDGLVGLLQIAGDLSGREEKTLELFLKDAL
jgi:hypothetical protein